MIGLLLIGFVGLNVLIDWMEEEYFCLNLSENAYLYRWPRE